MSEATEQVSVLVTGGASGLGEAVVRARAAAGEAVVIVDRNAERGAALAEELGAGVVFVDADVTDAQAVERAVETAVGLGALRAVISCAGVGTPKRILNRAGEPHPLELFRKVVEVNLIGSFNVLRLGAAAMAKNTPDADGQRGVVINTASIAAFDGQIGQAAYASSKAGIAGLTLPAARDLMKVGVRVVTIAPGLFDTPLLRGLPEEAVHALAANVPFPKRLGQPEEFAQLVAYVLGAPYLNGETIRLDGALRMAPR